MPTLRSVYLAGPDVFLPDPVGAFRAKIAVCREFGLLANLPDPAVARPLPGEAPQGHARRMYEEGLRLMRKSDAGIFHLTPFRGASADVGTVFELGFMAALGKPVFGYTNTSAAYLDRIAPRTQAGGRWVDADGCAIEDFGDADNLMLDMALVAAGAPIARIDAPAPERLTNITGFRECARRVRDHFASTQGPAATPSESKLLRERGTT